MKFLFLDFDGVLHPDNVFQSREHGLELVGPGSLLMHAPILETILDDQDPNGYIAIVLSTSWVKAVGHEKTLSYLSSGLANRVTDLTKIGWQSMICIQGPIHGQTQTVITWS